MIPAIICLHLQLCVLQFSSSVTMSNCVPNRVFEYKFPIYAKFIIGGLSGIMTVLILHPLDFMKIRMQLDGIESRKKQFTSTLDGARKIYANEGLLSFYNGLSAAIMRQALAASTRFGVYTTFFKLLSKDDEPPPFKIKVCLGMLAGMCGGLVGTPVDVCLIRLATDGAKPPQERFYYKHVFDGLYKVATHCGILGMWRGVLPTVLRGIMFNGTALSTYSQTKYMFLKNNLFEDNIYLHFTASTIAGIITATVVLPVDLMKTRIQQTREKLNILTVLTTTFKKEGFFAYWKGYSPYVYKVVPYNILTLIFLEKLTYFYNVYVLGNEKAKGNL